MGYRAYVCREYRVRYGEPRLDSRSGEVADLMESLCPGVITFRDTSEYGECWEMEPDKLRTVASLLRDGGGSIPGIPEGMTAGEIADTVLYWLSACDDRDDFVRVEWW